MADFQVKVEYRSEKIITFSIDVSHVYAGEYSLVDLCTDIIKRSPNLGHLSAGSLRIRYEDDEGSYINLELGDAKVFMEMWENAKEVPGREYRRVKLKACEINSPCLVVQKIDHVKTTRQDTLPSRRSLLHDSGCTMTSTSNTPDESEHAVSTPLDRLFKNLEKDIQQVTTELSLKKAQLYGLTSEVESARIVNHDKNNLLLCGQCHLREGHTKRNCTLGLCASAKSCGLFDKHPVEKGLKRKLEGEISALQNKLTKSQDNYQKKKVAYAKVNDTFCSKVEDELIASNPRQYIQNNCKNWLLINRHAAILEKKCGWKIPRRTETQQLLKELEL